MQMKSSWLRWIVAVSLSTAGSLPAGQMQTAVARRVTCTAWRPAAVTKNQGLSQPYAVMVPEQRRKTITTTGSRLISDVRRVEKRVKVPVIKTIEKPYTVIVPVREEKTVTRMVRIPSIEEIKETYQVRVPAIEEVTKLRTVIKRVPVQTTQAVTCPSGRWETETKQVAIKKVSSASFDPAAGQPNHQQTIRHRKWVPTLETREVPVTMWRCEQEKVPFTYRRRVYRLEERTRTRHVRRWREEERTHTVWVTKRVPETRTRKIQLKSWRWETQVEEITVNRRVPETHTEEVYYTVMVPKVRTCQTEATVSTANAHDKNEAAATKPAERLSESPTVVPCSLGTPVTLTACPPQVRRRMRFIHCRGRLLHQFRCWRWRRQSR